MTTYTQEDIERESDSHQFRAIIQLLQNKKNGFFIELGAADGILCSNTYRLERDFGWDGILIEPIKDYFDMMCSMRKASHKYNICIGETNGVVDFKRIEGYSKMLSGISTEYPVQHESRIDREVVERNQQVFIDKVVCRQLADVIVECGNPHIDYLSVDVEGGEFSVVKSLNMESNSIRPTVIGCENSYDDRRIEDYLKTFGYTKIGKVAIDDFYAIV
jgi:FkbM family methyltransferase